MSTTIDGRCPRHLRAAGRVQRSLALAALLVWVSHLAHGGDVAAPALTECSRPVILASSPVSKPSGSGALDVWSLVGGFVLVTVFAGMRRRQLFRDG